MKKTILDLCGGTGAWSAPYKENGYEVINVTLPDYDIRNYIRRGDRLRFLSGEYRVGFEPKFSRGDIEISIKDIYGILAAPPCTMFSLARTRAKKPRDFGEGMELVKKCLQIIWQVREQTKLAFWALENPMGYLRQFLGKPPFNFHPSDFGERYTKNTDLWGYFNEPIKKPIDLNQEELKLMSTNSRKLPSISDITGSKQSARRAITPRGFALAFYKANQ